MGLPLKYEKVAVKMAANAEGAGIPAPFVCIYTFVHLRGLLHSLCSLVIPYARRGAWTKLRKKLINQPTLFLLAVAQVYLQTSANKNKVG